MAEVWLASTQATSTERLVLKRIHPCLAADASFVKMFLAEAKLSARLEHPNIVRVVESGAVGAEPYLALEYVDGIDLRSLINHLSRSGVRLPLAAAAFVVREVARGLEHAHTLGLIHRDVSPSNIMVGFDGSVKLLDFGIAKSGEAADTTTRGGLLKGKFAYMAPERVMGLTIDQRIDQYSLGVVLHELITGARLFQGSDLQVLASVAAGQIARPSPAPTALERICMRALARTADDRFADCGQLADALDGLDAPRPWDASALATFLHTNVAPCEPTDMTVSARRRQRSVWWALSTGAVAALLLLLWVVCR